MHWDPTMTESHMPHLPDADGSTPTDARVQTVSSAIEDPMLRADELAPAVETGEGAPPSDVVVVDGRSTAIDEYIDQELTPLFAADPIGDAAIGHGDVAGRAGGPARGTSRAFVPHASDARRAPDVVRGSTVQLGRVSVRSRIRDAIRTLWRRVVDARHAHGVRSTR